MSNTIVLSLPDDVSDRVRRIAAQSSQDVEQVLINHIKTLSMPLPALPPDEQAELDALRSLSDDALWTIAREQMAELVQKRANELMNRNDQRLSDNEQDELDALTDRADRLMLRKAEAAAILRSRGYTFTQEDFLPRNA